jgi:short-subunit dehydrogenase
VASFTDQTIIITGASGGIGSAIACSLAEQGATVCLCGRYRQKLEAVAERMPKERARCYVADLSDKQELKMLGAEISEDNPRIDVLIHCAAIIAMGTVASALPEDFERQFKVNVLAPFQLTQLLLTQLIQAKGQILFINSSAALGGRPNVSQYAATKHALKALADSLRGECNALGVRVSSLFLGDTATPMQANIRKQQGRSYDPEHLIQPQDVAAMTLAVLGLPRTSEVTDVMIRPMKKT